MLEPERIPAANREVTSRDNQPPTPTSALVAEQREAMEPRKERLDYILERANAKQVTDRVTAGDAGDIIKIGREFLDIVEADRVARTKPYRDAADAAKAVADEFMDPLVDALAKLKARIDEWDAAEDARILAQQREQEQFFADAAKHESVPDTCPAPAPRQPELKPAKRSKIVGDLGARVHQVEEKTYRVVDVRAVPDMILNSETVKAAIIQVAKAMSKHMPKIDGIEITTGTTNRVQ